jgi:uncharacterized protein YcbK (DUF882 family)
LPCRCGHVAGQLMGDLTNNFSRSEFACKCGCGFDDIADRTVEWCQAVRDFFDRPVTVTSGCRCLMHNEEVGGAKSSQHLYGTAADIQVDGVDPDKVADFCEEVLLVDGLGRYNTFTHIDCRGHKARW